MLLLDTSFLIELEEEVAQRRVGPARKFIAENRKERFAISIVSVAEFAEGFEDVSKVEAFLRKFRKEPLHIGIAYLNAALQSSLPQRLGENDAWVAATASYNRRRLIGRDKAFRRVPDLKYVEF
jgi:predicted nucleic acid-binding protein